MSPDSTTDKLLALKAREPQTTAARLRALYDVIEECLAAGATHQEVCEVLNKDWGTSLNVQLLAAYRSRERRRRRKMGIQPGATSTPIKTDDNVKPAAVNPTETSSPSTPETIPADGPLANLAAHVRSKKLEFNPNPNPDSLI